MEMETQQLTASSSEVCPCVCVANLTRSPVSDLRSPRDPRPETICSWNSETQKQKKREKIKMKIKIRLKNMRATLCVCAAWSSLGKGRREEPHIKLLLSSSVWGWVGVWGCCEARDRERREEKNQENYEDINSTTQHEARTETQSCCLLTIKSSKLRQRRALAKGTQWQRANTGKKHSSNNHGIHWKSS